MADSTSNIDDVGEWLNSVVDDFNFLLPGKDESVGKDMANTVAEGIVDRSVPDAKGPDGEKWDENEAKYSKRKAKRYDAYQPGILTGQMLSEKSLFGQTTITSDSVEMKYGTGETPTRARNGDADDRDMIATDKEKAEWFTEGGRSFYELDETINSKLVDVSGEALAEYIKERDVSGL